MLAFMASVGVHWLNFLCVHEIPEPLCGLQNATGASIQEVLSSKLVNFQRGVNYPFKCFVSCLLYIVFLHFKS